MSEAFEAAKRLTKEFGWSIIAIDPGTKRPAIEWKKYQTEHSRPPEWIEWFDDHGFTTGVVCGRVSGVVVLDIDSAEGYEWWVERIGEIPLLQAAFQQSPKVTEKGLDERIGHYWFRLPEVGTVRSKAMHNDPRFPGVEWDLRGEGNQVLVAPAAGYRWVRPFSLETPEIPGDLVVAAGAAAGRPSPRGGQDGDGGEVVPLGTMTSLWTNPGLGGRNNWVTKLLGHYAKQYRRMPDMFEFEAERVWETARDLPSDDGHPYERDEFERTLASVWGAETGRYDSDPETGLPVRQAHEDNGFLIGAGTRILAQCRTKTEDGYVVSMESWGDFDLEALGVVDDENSERVYDVVIRTPRNPEGRRLLLANSTLNDHRKLILWLGNQGAGIAPPDNIWPRSGASHDRLRKYLEDQDPPRFQVVQSLGWDGEGFICHEGRITAEGLQPHGERRPDPRLVGWAPYRYGFERTPGEAIEVLREVLTFHDETVTAVFGAWWAACVLKPQFQEYVSLFPFMAIEAASESGKTTGFFPMMMQLGGNSQGHMLSTKAALRDSMSAHRSGIVWVDDADDVSHLTELLRAATGEGAMQKKGEDRTSQIEVELVAPICLSGESLGLKSQKALVDRAVMVDVPSPTRRRSLRDPSKLQWADIVAMQQRYNQDLTCLAGTLVQEILSRAPMVAGVSSETTGGRYGDKIATIITGAKILGDMLGDPTIEERVREWAGAQEDVGSENTLTLSLVPTALRMQDFPRAPMKGDSRVPATPAWIDRDGIVWVSIPHLAEWWSWLRSGRIVVRTESEDALMEQIRLVSDGAGRKRFNLSGDKNSKSMYWPLTAEVSKAVLRRSQGGSEGGVEVQSSLAAAGGQCNEDGQLSPSLGVIEPSLDWPVWWAEPPEIWG